jgi:uncharacterized protein YndB with AHSA1/START domain
MRLPDGREIWGIGIYRDIVEPERIVYVDSFADENGNPVPPTHYGMSADHPAESLVTVTFAEQAGKTKLTFPEAVKEREDTQKGWAQMFDRFANYLAKPE